MLFAVSVTTKRTVSPSFSRLRLFSSTRPPTRNARPFGASFIATCVGREEEHEIRLEGVEHQRRGDAEHADAGTDPEEAAVAGLHRAPPVAADRLSGAVEPRLLARAAGAGLDRDDLGGNDQRRDAVRAPDVPRVTTHGEKFFHDDLISGSAHTQAEPRSRSSMIARTRTSDTAMV